MQLEKLHKFTVVTCPCAGQHVYFNLLYRFKLKNFLHSQRFCPLVSALSNLWFSNDMSRNFLLFMELKGHY
jgi:hypothetical protein